MEPILELARRQGYITTAQAIALGGHEHTLGRLVRAGKLIKTIRSIYLTAVPRTPEAAHALVTRAFLESDRWSVASHHSALALQGINLHGVPWDQLHVADPRKSSRSHASLHRHVLRDGDPVIDVGAHKSLALPLALCQVGARFGVTAGLVAMDHALHQGLCTTDDLAAVIESGRLRRGIGAARRAVSLADHRSQSPGESRLREIVAQGPFMYDLQVNVGAPGDGYVVDLLVDGCVVLEFDGGEKYEGLEGKKALVAEKRREDWIRGEGYGFMRTMWPELDYPVAVRHVLTDKVVVARAAGGPKLLRGQNLTSGPQTDTPRLSAW